MFLKNQKKVKSILSKLVCVPIEFEHKGSEIIFSDLQKRYVDEELLREKNIKYTFKDVTKHFNE